MCATPRSIQYFNQPSFNLVCRSSGCSKIIIIDPNNILGQKGHKAPLKYSNILSESCSLLQKSHWELARNKLEQAKTDALHACNLINKLLSSSDKSLHEYISSLAHYSLAYYKGILEKGAASLSAQDKFCWLTSASATGGYWFPVISLGKHSSIDIAPLETSDEGIQLPDFGPENPIRFRSIETSLLDSFSELSLDVDPSSIEKKTLEESIHYDSDPLQDLYQDVLSDCSFVSSLLSISDMGLTSKVRDLISIFDNGTAKVRLLVDGCWRETAITTNLPSFDSTENRFLYVHSATRSALLWPALIEKAYVTHFDGHYCFGGSNMANDTFMLTGWLPEIRLVSQISQATFAEFWNIRKSGNLMIGLGTGTVSSSLEKNLGIISNHDYLLGDYDSAHGSYTLINPWTSKEEGNKKGQRVLNFDNQLLRQFKFLYLNWKPFHKHEVKLFFVTSVSQWPDSFLGDKPQFYIRNGTREYQDVYILVEKFKESKSDFSVSIWKNTKNIIYTSDQFDCVAGGKFVNSKHYLIRLELEPLADYVLAVVSRDQKPSKFAITVHHDAQDVLITRARSLFAFTLPNINGGWGQNSSGGNWSHETFIKNPQYDFEIEKKTRFMVVLASEKKNIDVNVHLLHCSTDEKNKMIRKFDQAGLVFNEKYSSQLFYRSTEKLEPGNYKIVVSTYNRGESSDFKLLIAHDGDGALSISPTTRALGTFIKDTSFEWRTSNRRKLEILTSHSKTEITLHLRSGESDIQTMNNYRPAIRASVFDAVTRRPVVINSRWDDSVYGVFIDCCLPESNRSYILLVERFETGEGVCRVSTGSSHRIGIKEYSDE